MADFIMTVGVSGSGKSYFARQYKLNSKSLVTIFDSDRIREELFGDRYDQSHNDKVFGEMERRTIHFLQNDISVIYCATNLAYRRRANLVKKLRAKVPDAHYECVVLNTRLDTCKMRNAMREHPVPEYALNRQARSFQMPLYSEGWDTISCVRGEEWYEWQSDNLLEEIWDKAAALTNQNNHHHRYSLCRHCVETVNHLKSEDHELIAATLWHDLGKAFTEVKDENGESHYPGHDCVGALLALSYFNNIHIAQLICYHMKPYAGLQEKMCWAGRCGETLWNEIMKLHEADAAAH